MKNLQTVGVNFSSGPKLYHYFTDLPVEIGDYCIALVRGKELALVKIKSVEIPSKDSHANMPLLYKLDLDQVLYGMQDLMLAIEAEINRPSVEKL